MEFARSRRSRSSCSAASREAAATPLGVHGTLQRNRGKPTEMSRAAQDEAHAAALVYRMLAHAHASRTVAPYTRGVATREMSPSNGRQRRDDVVLHVAELELHIHARVAVARPGLVRHSRRTCFQRSHLRHRRQAHGGSAARCARIRRLPAGAFVTATRVIAMAPGIPMQGQVSGVVRERPRRSLRAVTRAGSRRRGC